MSLLTSLLARDRVVPVSRIEEALERQVLEGGDEETILLEMGLVPEDTLSAYRAALFGLLPATRDEVMKAGREAVRLVPRDMARDAGILPLVYEGRNLVLAASDPPADWIRTQLASGLSCELSIRIVTPPRLQAALAHHYGFELVPRLRRLMDVLRKKDPGAVPYVRPPGPSLRPSRPQASIFSDRAPDTLEYPVLPRRPLDRVPDGLPGGLVLSEPGTGRAEPDDELAVPASIPKAPRSPTATGYVLGRLSSIPPATVSGHVAKATRGPMTLERAKELLLEVPQRDDVLYVLLRYAQQFFDFAALFSVSKEGARGRVASGARVTPEQMEQALVPLEGPGVFARVARDKRPLVGDASIVDVERSALLVLGRPLGKPALLVPILLGSRPILILYAEREVEGVAAEDAEPILALVPALSDALRRIIVEQKALRRSTSPPPAASARPGATEQRGDGERLAVSHGAPAAVDVTATQAAVVANALEEPSPKDEPSLKDEPLAPEITAQASAHAPTEVAFPASHPAAATTPLDGGMAAAPADELEAVDLDRVSYGAAFERRRETRRGAPMAATPVDPEARDAARGRLMGIPRTAPPPPARDSGAPGRPAGGYSFIAPSGAVVQEDLRPAQKTGPGPLGLRDPPPAQVIGAPLAQIRPRPAELRGEEDKAAAEPPPDAETPSRSSITQLAEEANASVIIDMGDQITGPIERLISAGPADELPEIDALLRIGEAALPMLVQVFPGTLWFDRNKPYKRRPRGRDVSALARALVAFGERAAPYLASRLNDDDSDTVFYAIMVAAEIPHVDLLDGVARRALDPDDALRAVALDALRSFAHVPQLEAVLRAFAQLSERPGKDPRRQRLSVEALSELRDPRALPALLPRLSDSAEGVVQAAHRGLVLLTAQDFGLAQRKWESWVEQNAALHRVEWLIDALMHADESLRTLAGEEIKQLTQQYFGYHPQLPKRDREVAQRKYREWWEDEGRVQFGR